MSTENDLVPKKIVAVEMYKLNKSIQNLSLIGIFGSLLGGAVIQYTSIGGAIIIGAVISTATYFLYHARKNMLYLNEKYNLGFKIVQPRAVK